MDEKYIGQEVVTTTQILNKGKDNFEAIMLIKHGRSLDLKNWEYKEQNFKAFGKNLDDAYKELLFNVNRYMQVIEGDMFNDVEAHSFEVKQA